MAGWPGGQAFQPERILIAIDADFPNAQCVAGLLALHPQFLARARSEMRVARRLRGSQSLGVHMREHEHLAGFGMGDDRANQARSVIARRQALGRLDTHGKPIGASVRAAKFPWPLHYYDSPPICAATATPDDSPTC